MSHLVGDFRSRPTEGIWHSLNKFVLTLIVVATAVPIGYSFLPEVSKRKAQLAQIEALKERVDEQRMELARNNLEETLLKNDPEYQSIIARDKLNLMKEGEVIYRIDPPKPDASKLKLKK